MDYREKLKKNLNASFANFVATLAIQVAATPIFLKAWGPETYGSWLTVASIAAVLILGELGLSGVLSNHVVMATHDKKDADSAVLLSAGSKVVLLGHIALIVFISIAAATAIDHGWITVSMTVAQVVQLIVAWSVYLLLGFYITALGGVLRSVGKFVFASYFSTSIRILEFLAMVALLYAGFGPIGVLIGAAVTRLTGVGALCIMTAHLAPNFIGSYSTWSGWKSISSIKKISGAGIATVLLQVASTISNHWPVLLVGVALGPVAVATFVASRTLARIATQMGSIVSLATNPEFTELLHRKRLNEASKLLGVLSAGLVAFGLLIAIFVGLAGQSIFSSWTRGHLQAAPALLVVLTMSGALSGLYGVLLGFVQATNAHRTLARQNLAMTVVVLGLVSLVPSPSLELIAVAALLLDTVCTVLGLHQALRLLDSSFPSFAMSSIQHTWRELRRVLPGQSH